MLNTLRQEIIFEKVDNLSLKSESEVAQSCPTPSDPMD